MDDEDPRVLRCAALLLAKISMRFVNPPRVPDRLETQVLRHLQERSAMPVNSDDTESVLLLQRLWHGLYGSDVSFQLFGAGWKVMGFQHPRDATSDFRGGGMLSLEALVYIVERHPDIVKGMFLRHKERAIQGPYNSFPWACAGITLSRKLCELLQVTQPLSGIPSEVYKNSPSTFWHVAKSSGAFLELFTWTFVCLERTWDVVGASYMDFGRILTLTMKQTHDMLQRLPANVVPATCAPALIPTGHHNTFHDIIRTLKSKDEYNPILEFSMIEEEGKEKDDITNPSKYKDDEFENKIAGAIVFSGDGQRDKDHNSTFNSIKMQSTSSDSLTSVMAPTADLLGLCDFNTDSNTKPVADCNDNGQALLSSVTNLDFFDEFGV